MLRVRAMGCAVGMKGLLRDVAKKVRARTASPDFGTASPRVFFSMSSSQPTTWTGQDRQQQPSCAGKQEGGVMPRGRSTQALDSTSVGDLPTNPMDAVNSCAGAVDLQPPCRCLEMHRRLDTMQL